MQTAPGVFSEVALKRYDFVLAQCAQVLRLGWGLDKGYSDALCQG